MYKNRSAARIYQRCINKLGSLRSENLRHLSPFPTSIWLENGSLQHIDIATTCCNMQSERMLVFDASNYRKQI